MQLTSIYLLGADGACPNRDKVMGQERNLQGSSSSHGAAPGGPTCPLGELLGRERNLQGSSSPRGCPGGPVCPFPPSVVLLLGFLFIFGNIIYSNKPPWKSLSLFGNAHDCSGSGHNHKPQVRKEKATGIVWLLA